MAAKRSLDTECETDETEVKRTRFSDPIHGESSVINESSTSVIVKPGTSNDVRNESVGESFNADINLEQWSSDAENGEKISENDNPDMDSLPEVSDSEVRSVESKYLTKKGIGRTIQRLENVYLYATAERVLFSDMIQLYNPELKVTVLPDKTGAVKGYLKYDNKQFTSTADTVYNVQQQVSKQFLMYVVLQDISNLPESEQETLPPLVSLIESISYPPCTKDRDTIDDSVRVDSQYATIVSQVITIEKILSEREVTSYEICKILKLQSSAQVKKENKTTFSAMLKFMRRKFCASGHSKEEAQENSYRSVMEYILSVHMKMLSPLNLYTPYINQIMQNASQKVCSAPSSEESDDISYYKVNNYKFYTKLQKPVNCYLPDLIAFKVLEKFAEVMPEQKYTVLSGVILVRDNNFSDANVVCVATGNKCIVSQNLSSDGTVVIDMHAEILARRALLRYLYSELKLAMLPSDNTIFEATKTDPKMYRLKLGVSFYLFVSSAPCGSSRIFVVSDNNAGVEKDAGRNRANRNVLRVKLERGAGTIPSTSFDPHVQDVKDVADIGRLLIMSCSDKLLKRNILGLQGSLLTHFIEPIYYEGVVIKDYFNLEHCGRSLYGRVKDKVDFLTGPYKLNTLYTDEVILKLPCNEEKRPYAMNWILGHNIELLNTNTGMTVDQNLSRLSKIQLFELFVQLCKLRDPTFLSNGCIKYDKMKQEATEYQDMKKKLFDMFKNDAHLGYWISKPPSTFEKLL